MTINDTIKTTLPGDQLMAAMCHISALIPPVGIIVPLIVWVTQRDKSRYLSFHALQAAGFQVSMTLLLILSWGCQFSSILPALLILPLQALKNSTLTSISSVIASLYSIFSMIFSSLACLVFLAAILYAILAAIMVFQGRDFRYIILGRRIEKFINK